MKENSKEFIENRVSSSPESPSALPGLPVPGEKERRSPTSQESWSLIKTDYIVGKGSLRVLAARHGLSESTVMKRACREHWASSRALTSSKVDAMVEATLEQRAQEFVKKSADQTDRFLTRVSQSEIALQTEDRQGLRQLAGTFKDVVSIGRETYQLGLRDEGRGRCIVNLDFLANYAPEPAAREVVATIIEPT